MCAESFIPPINNSLPFYFSFSLGSGRSTVGKKWPVGADFLGSGLSALRSEEKTVGKEDFLPLPYADF